MASVAHWQLRNIAVRSLKKMVEPLDFPHIVKCEDTSALKGMALAQNIILLLYISDELFNPALSD